MTASSRRYPVTGQIFSYTFVALFIYVVLNVFIAIIEESFFTVVQRGKAMVEEMRCGDGSPLSLFFGCLELPPRAASHTSNPHPRWF